MKNLSNVLFLILSSFALSANSNTCTFVQGYELGLARDPYQGTCTLESETLFLKGYAIGRKMSWVEGDLQTQTNLIDCLNEERQRKFGGTLSPVHLDIGYSENCPTESLRTEKEFEPKIAEAEKLKKALIPKRLRLQKLRDRATMNPSQIDALIKDYEQSGPIDELDVNLRWKPYVASKGGTQKIDSQTRALIIPEISGQSSLPVNLVEGCAIGFGLGHSRQNRFNESGWKFAVIDSAVLLGLIYGVTKKDSMGAMLGVLGIPVSRVFQLLDVQEYDSNNRINIENLRTQNHPEIKMFSYTWNW